MSRSFVVTAKREFSIAAEPLFNCWADAGLRKIFLSDPSQRTRLVECDFCEGGQEVIEARWRNKVIGRNVNQFRIIRPNSLVVSQSVYEINGKPSFVTTDFFELSPTERQNTRATIAAQVLSVVPIKIDGVKQNLNDLMDRFVDAANLHDVG